MKEPKQYKLLRAEDGIFHQPTKEKVSFERDTIKEHRTTAYAYDGHGKTKEIDEKNHLAWARILHINGREKYYVKVCKVGNNIGLLPNPKSVNFVNNETSANVGGIPMYQWHSVKKDVFDHYLKFLITGDKKWVRSAQSKLQS